MEDLGEIRQRCLAGIHTFTTLVLQHMEGEAVEAELDEIQNCVRNYCELEIKLDLEAKALAMVEREVDPTNLDSVDDKFNTYLDKLLKESRANVDMHPFMREFKEITTRRSQHLSQDSVESDVVLTETQQSRTQLDAITLKPIEDPVRNGSCGHLYERAAILDYIKSRPGARCPVAGCGNSESLQPEHLVEHERPPREPSRAVTVDDMDDMDSQ